MPVQAHQRPYRGVDQLRMLRDDEEVHAVVPVDLHRLQPVGRLAAERAARHDELRLVDHDEVAGLAPQPPVLHAGWRLAEHLANRHRILGV